MQWDTLFADRTQLMQRSAIREILKLTAQPDVISFAGGLPAPELFPVQRIREATDIVLAERGREVLQYSTSEGMPELRAFIANWLSDDALHIDASNILIVNGSQQSLDLIGRILLDTDDRVIVEEPTYLGMLTAWRPYSLQFMTVPTDQDGMMVEELEALMAHEPKAIYSIPNFQNPQGVTMSLERRQRLAEILAKYPVPFVEDNPYGELRYSGEPLPSVLQLEAHQRGSQKLDGSVIYAGTFSKVLTPGLRIGWVAAHEAVIEKLVQVKQSTDLHTSTLNQFITYEVVRDEAFFKQHVAMLRDVYRQRRDLMLSLMETHFPPEVRWTHPEGGLFLMVTMPNHVDAGELLKRALEYKVAFVPCESFFIGDGGRSTFRLNFSNARPEMIEEGIRRLGTLLKEALVAVP